MLFSSRLDGEFAGIIANFEFESRDQLNQFRLNVQVNPQQGTKNVGIERFGNGYKRLDYQGIAHERL